MREIKEPEWPEKNDLDRIHELYGERAGNILDYCEGENEMRESCIKAFKAWQEAQTEKEPKVKKSIRQYLCHLKISGRYSEDEIKKFEDYFNSWKEAQAGEYIKQAVYNGYSLKSDKPPLLPLDEEKLKDILKEHLTLLYETYEQCERDYNSCAKAICSKFATTPSVKKVSDLYYTNCKVRIKEGWDEAYKVGRALGEPIWVEQDWLPVLWHGDEDPDFHKLAGIEILVNPNRKPHEENKKRSP